jgi:hypothetical protein
VRRRRVRWLARVLAALTVLSGLSAIPLTLLASSPAAAQPQPIAPWSVAPAANPGARPVFQFVADPGQTITDQVTVANRTDQPITFFVYAADAYNTPAGGAFATKLPSQHQTEVGTWVQLPVQLLTVPGGQQATFPFTFQVPANATPGDHAGAIIAQNTTPSQAQQGPVVVPVIRGVGTRIYTRVNGPVHPGLSVTNAATKSSIGALSFINDDARGSAQFQVRNNGNVSLNAVARVKAVDTFGHTIKQFAPTRMAPLLPGARVTIKEPTIGLPRVGLVTYKMNVTAQGAKASGEARQFIIPWLLLAIIAALIVAFVLWRWQRRRRRRQGGQPSAPEPEPEPETAVMQ